MCSFLLRFFCLGFATTLLVVTTRGEILPPGHRPLPYGVHALVGGKIVSKPGEVITNGTIVISNGFIVAVARQIEPPADARVWRMDGLTIYPGFIDPYLSIGSSNPPVTTTRTEPIAGWDRSLTSGGFFGVPGEETDPGGRGPGYQLEAVRSHQRAAESYTPNGKLLESMHELGFTAANVLPEGGILRGSSALVALAPANPNDALIKADVCQHVAFALESGRDAAYPRSLMGGIAAVRQAFFDADYYFRDREHYRQHKNGRKRPAYNPALEPLVPAVDRDADRTPVVFEPGSVLMVDRAGRIGRELGLKFYIVASGQEWRRPDLVKAAAAPFIVPINFPELPKLPEDDDWEQITLDQLRAWDWAPSNPALLRESGLEIAFTTYGMGDKKNFRKKLRLALDRGLKEEDALAALTTVPAKLCGVENQLGSIEAGKIANLTIVEGDYFQPDAKVREVWIDGRVFPTKPAVAKSKEPGQEPAKAGTTNGKETNAVTNPDTLKLDPKSRQVRGDRIARSPREGRGVLAAPSAVIVRNATVWTCGPQGRLENASLLVVGGKVRAVGANVQFSGTETVIDAEGKHVTPGLIDAHSHSMILGAVNEGTLPSSAMVRIGDVVNSETAHIYRQLAGGLTVANLLHGSANPIGGQNCIIKLRDGASPEEVKMEGAPSGIKFALGENVKQSNWGERNSTRFPQSRMGVGTFFANRFTAAQQYLKQRENQKPDATPVRRDLELETLGEILQGQRWVHCHSYRQDEILAFLRTMEGFGVKVGTLQHVLEGYKVADEIARHGAGASCFADWWAYKFEVYDAIPYAGSLMHSRGVLVSFNSDSSDHARRLHLEAAKAVKYGATTEEEALKFVTLNPARQLRIDSRVGSLEPGKDGDFVIWSKSPLDSTVVCLETWIEGRKYFDRTLDSERTRALQKEREDLVVKAKRILRTPGKSLTGDEIAQSRFFEVPLEHRYDAYDRHCLDEE